jgi:hypothetical protein
VVGNFAGQTNEIIHIFVQLQGEINLYTIQTNVVTTSAGVQVFENAAESLYTIIASCTAYTFSQRASALAVEVDGVLQVVLLGTS